MDCQHRCVNVRIRSVYEVDREDDADGDDDAVVIS